MSVTIHERPGVYSDYDASSASSTTGGLSVVAVAGRCDGAEQRVTLLTSLAGAYAAYGENSPLSTLCRVLYANGAGVVLACPAGEDYAEAFRLLLAERKASFLVCDSGSSAVHAAMKDAIEAAVKERNECIGLVGLPNPTAAQLLRAAEGLNSERMVLCGPDCADPEINGALMGGWCVAAAVAGRLAEERDPALPLGGAELNALGTVTQTYGETELDALVRGGVTVVETVAGTTSVVRGITSRSTTGGAPDSTWRELTTILIVDEVIPALRNALRARFARCKNNGTTRAAIRAQVVMELEDRIAREIIEGYDHLSVRADSSDPTLCLVEFDFTVVHGLSRIYLTAHITV